MKADILEKKTFSNSFPRSWQLFAQWRGGYNLSFRVQLALERSRNPKKYLDYVLFGRSHFADIHPCVHGCHGGKITLHLLFGWSLDKDEKSLDQSKQFSWQFGSIQTKAFPNPDQPPLEIFLINQYFCTKNKIIDNEKWKLLETLQYTIKEFNNGNVVCSTMHCPNGSRWGGGREKGCTDFVYSIV